MDFAEIFCFGFTNKTKNKTVIDKILNNQELMYLNRFQLNAVLNVETDYIK